ncbi:MAG: CAP domain-containing protein [Vicinamibacterales bacterium]
MADKPACLVVMLVSGMLAGLSSAAPEGRDDEAARAVVAAPDVAAAVAELTNAERTRAGLAELRASLRLVQAAQIHAEQMARLRRLDHVLRDADHPRPEDRLAAVAYRWQAWAENVASGQRTAAEVVAGWMRSPGHRANIMSSSVTELGAGYARDASGRPYWVQVFGRPLS